MTPQQVAIRDQQQQAWDAFSGGWQRWDVYTMAMLEPIGKDMIRAMQLQPMDHVLDVAAGTGEPGLTIAAHVPQGRVVITDLSDEMLTIARSKLAASAFDHVSIQACDACALPFADAEFDVVSCRMGFMFFPDMQLAAREMCRVLKPGGTLVASVWTDPATNYWVTAIMDVVKRHVNVPAPDPDGPSMFRCAGENVMVDLFRSVGFTKSEQKLCNAHVDFPDAETFCTMFLEVSAPITAALKDQPASLHEQIYRESVASIKERIPTMPTRFNTSSWIVTAQKA